MSFRFSSALLFLIICTTAIHAQSKDSVLAIKMGWQVWMVNNLNVDHFKNGDLIPLAKNATEWREASDKGLPAWCYYENAQANGTKYGKLYNWWAVHDSRGLAPKGWHITTDLEWTLIIASYLDGETVAGMKLKNSFGWNKTKEGSNGNGTNSTGFTGLPGGTRVTNGIFSLLGKMGGWWTSTEEGNTAALLYFLYNEDGEIHKDNNVKGCGYSVRCIKD